MRIKITLQTGDRVIPFAYQHKLVGALHQWVGDNQIHDAISLYSLSWLCGGKRSDQGIVFPNGATWFISAWDDEIIAKVIDNSRKDTDVCFGMTIIKIEKVPCPDLSIRNRFKVLSPVLIRDHTGKHLLYSDPGSGKILTDIMRRKMTKAGIQNSDVSIRFDTDYLFPKTKLVDIKGIKSRANLCPVIIDGSEEVKNFAWHVGIGHSTGCCFGALQ